MANNSNITLSQLQNAVTSLKGYVNEKDQQNRTYTDDSIKALVIPTVTNDLTDELKTKYDAAYDHSQSAHFDGNYNSLTNKPTIPSVEGLASETYVNQKVADLVASAPESLDTLNELAAALGNDANFSATMINLIGTKADKTQVDALPTKKYVDDAIAAIPPTDFTGYATEKYVDDAIAAIPAVDFTGYATEAYVNQKVSDLVASAPEALDTLNELAKALGNDANFSATVTNLIATKADKTELEGLATEAYVDETIATQIKDTQATDAEVATMLETVLGKSYTAA